VPQPAQLAASALRRSPAFPAAREAFLGPQWVHEIKLEGFRMAARIDNGRAQLLTRTGLDWSDEYPSIIAAFSNSKAETTYLDGELGP
jgi:ATP-dependent DNA ligase